MHVFDGITGAEKWATPSTVFLATSPVIDANNNIYVAGAKGVFSYDSEGRLRWNYLVGRFGGSTSTIIDRSSYTRMTMDSKGALYVALSEQNIISIR